MDDIGSRRRRRLTRLLHLGPRKLDERRIARPASGAAAYEGTPGGDASFRLPPRAKG